MPAEYHIVESANAVFSRAWGTLSDSDLLEHQQALTTDPAFTPGLHQLFDFTEVAELTVTTGGIRLLASRNRFGAGAKRAFIVDPGAMAVFGMLRMFQILNDEHPDELRVQFDHIRKARSWLGLPEQKEPDRPLHGTAADV